MSSDEDEETPLDPAVERVRQRLKRLILISVVTLFVGLAAVVAAVLYKVGPSRDKPVLTAVAGETMVDGALPADAQLLATALDGRTLALTYAEGPARRVVVIDLATGKVLRRLRLDGLAPPATP